MPIDSSIPLSVKPVQVENPLNALARVLQAQGLQQQNQIGQITLQQNQRALDQTNKLNQLYAQSVGQDGTIDRTALFRGAAQQGIGSQIPALQRVFQETDTAAANLAKAKADIATKKTAMFRDALSGVTNPQQASQWLSAQYQDPDLKGMFPVPYEQAASQIPQDQQGFNQWVQRQALGMSKFIEHNAPKTTTADTGNAVNILQTPGLGGAPQIVGTMPKQVSADTIYKQKQENMRAGFSADGGTTPDMERTAQAVAAGQLPPPTGIALLNPKNQRMLARVMEINPQYDFSTVSAKKAAATAFTSGSLGNALRSVSTANAHLDQLGELADALNNGDIQIINKVKNAYQTQTGNPAPTNFDGVKQIVGQEVVKAIIAGGGGVGEREEAAKSFSNARSPAQLKDLITHYRMIMGAQQANLMEQRRAAGLPDSTLPKYNGGEQTQTGNSQIDALLKKYGQ